MAEVIHEHTTEKSDSSGMGFLFGTILLILVVIFFIYFAMPYLRSTTSSPQINIPGQIDVNINQPSK